MQPLLFWSCCPEQRRGGRNSRPQVSCLITTTKTERPGRLQEGLHLLANNSQSGRSCVCKRACRFYEWFTGQGLTQCSWAHSKHRYRAMLSSTFSLPICLHNCFSNHVSHLFTAWLTSDPLNSCLGYILCFISMSSGKLSSDVCRIQDSRSFILPEGNCSATVTAQGWTIR